MSIVTRGIGIDTGPHATSGFGIFAIPIPPIISEFIGQTLVLASRSYSATVERNWSVSLQRVFSTALGERMTKVLVVTRTYTMNLTRSFAVWLKRVFKIHGDE